MQTLWSLVGWHFSETSVVASGFIVAWMTAQTGNLFDILRRAITGRDIPVDSAE